MTTGYKIAAIPSYANVFRFCFVAATDKRRSCQKKVIIRSLQSAKKLKICENVNSVVLRMIQCPHMFVVAPGRLKKIAQSGARRRAGHYRQKMVSPDCILLTLDDLAIGLKYTLSELTVSRMAVH
ncbi:MAG: hypothetical protein L0H15_08420 [Nitrosospira sp.]|nr:hypothetical protein [Nitrosospira sp.]MDN5936643.1 hypothetical protein [Nitrosospira sp.]